MSRYAWLFNFHRPAADGRAAADGLEQVLAARERLARINEREQALVRMLREQLYINVIMDRLDNLTGRLEALERGLNSPTARADHRVGPVEVSLFTHNDGAAR